MNSNNPFHVISVGIAAMAIILYSIAVCTSGHLPNRFKCFGNSGFEVGKTYIRYPSNSNPFREGGNLIDTITVVQILNRYVKFDDNTSTRIPGGGKERFELIKINHTKHE